MGATVFLSLVAALALSGSLGETPPIAATTLEEFQRKKAWDEGATTGRGIRRRRRRRRSLAGEASGQGVRANGLGEKLPTQSTQSKDEKKSNDPTEPPESWKGAGGPFGLDGDWRNALQEEGGDGAEDGLRGEGCMTHDNRKEVKEVLEKRKVDPPRQKVAVCLRTKDYGRFLPEWVAFHYAIGVDEVSIYDDNSADQTSEVLKPFVKAGIVRYIFDMIPGRAAQMEPLNRCLRHYINRKEEDPENAPSWLLFHDTDEYAYPRDTNITLFDALNKHESTCCALVRRFQYGSGGHDEMPRGLVMDSFMAHQNYSSPNPKVVVNLTPTESDPVAPPLKSMHKAEGCKCLDLKQEVLINHYLGSRGDYLERVHRYWSTYMAGDNDPVHRLNQRDVNDRVSDTITHWSCSTREVLYRVVNGLDLQTGMPPST
ncbi:unnamed protein product [Ectocarpus sp. 4 AP-2014]